MIRRPPRSTPLYSSAASDVYKRQAIICNHQSDPFLFSPFYCFMGHREYFTADGVHLGMEFKTEDPVAKIDHGGAAVLFNNFIVSLEDRKGDMPRFLRHFQVRALKNAVVIITAIFKFVE